MSINSREKGARGEREWRDILRKNGYSAHRGVQYQGGKDSPDVVCPDLPWIHWEVKLSNHLVLAAALAQAQRDAPGLVGVVAHRNDRSLWLITMRDEDFYQMLNRSLSAAQDALPFPALTGEPQHMIPTYPGLSLVKPQRGCASRADQLNPLCPGPKKALVLAERLKPSGYMLTVCYTVFFAILRGELPKRRSTTDILTDHLPPAGAEGVAET